MTACGRQSAVSVFSLTGVTFQELSAGSMATVVLALARFGVLVL
jgi:hypothetical protein